MNFAFVSPLFFYKTNKHRFSVCGQISVTRFPDSIKQITKYKVNMWPQDKEKAVLMTAETDARGGFCFKARPGLYVLQVFTLSVVFFA